MCWDKDQPLISHRRLSRCRGWRAPVAAGGVGNSLDEPWRDFWDWHRAELNPFTSFKPGASSITKHCGE